ncbi:MAG: lysophospholipid acyltransferase family protein [Opitutales bacterium]
MPATSETDPSPPSPPKAKAAGNTRVRAIPWWGRMVIDTAGLLLRLWGRTWRITADETSLAAIRNLEHPMIFVAWHNRLFTSVELHRRFRTARPIKALVSASKDGAWLAAFFDSVGVGNVRGSSSFRGREAVLALREALSTDSDVFITPDGPRGPCYRMTKSPALLAQASGAPVILLSATFTKAWRLKSWDRFYLPKPFSRWELVCRRFENLDALREAFPAETPEASFQACLDALTVDLPKPND